MIIKKSEIDIKYQSSATEILQNENGDISGIRIKSPQGYQNISCHSVVLACGGFEANPEMRTRYLGPGWELAKVRGTQFNTGDGINMA